MADPLNSDEDRIISLVSQALRKPEAERRAFLKGACGPDSEAFREAASRVAWEERMEGFLDPEETATVGASAPQPGRQTGHPFRAGEVLAERFRLIRRAGRGGMGTVYEAFDEKLARRIAIKISRHGHQRRLSPEVRNATGISHPNVCKIHEIHTAQTPEGEVDFLTMEFVDGRTLLERIEADGRLPIAEAMEIGRQICAGLEEAHRKGVIHGDLKSANIMLTRSARGEVVPLIMDFGLAVQGTAGEDGALQGSAVGGTPGYMAPEVRHGGKASAASDLYAVGVILYEAISGALPRESKGRDGKLRIEPVGGLVRGVPRRLDALILRCLDANPARRPATAAEASAAIVGRPVGGWTRVTTAALASLLLAGLPVARNPDREPVRLALLPFSAPASHAAPAQQALTRAGGLLGEIKPSNWRFSVVPVGESIRRGVRTPGQACRELGATHALTGTLQPAGSGIAVEVAVVAACSQDVVEELRLEYGEDGSSPAGFALARFAARALDLPAEAPPREILSPDAHAAYDAGMADLRFESGVDSATASLERAAGLETRSPAILAGLAEAYYLKSKMASEPRFEELAGETTKKAESLDPDSAAVCKIAGMLQLDAGHYAMAVKLFRRAITLDPRDPDGYRRLARVQEKMDQSSEAGETLRRAIAVSPGYYKSYQQLGGFYYDQGKYEKAAAEFQEMIRLTEGKPDGHGSLAAAFVKLGKYGEAEREFRTALALRPESYTYNDLGAVLAYENRDPEAIACYRKAVEMAPKEYLAWTNLGDSLRRTHRLERAGEAYRRALALTVAELARAPQDATVRAFAGYLLARLGERRQAELETQESLGFAPSDAQVLRVAVLAFEALGRREQALAVLKYAPWEVLDDLKRQPDMADLARDSRFLELWAGRKQPG